MTMNFGDVIRFPNACLQVDEGHVLLTRTLRAEEAMKIGHIVKKGTAADQVLKDTGTELAIGFVYAVWNADFTSAKTGQRLVKPGSAVAAGDYVEVAFFQSGIVFVGALPNGVTTALYEKLKTATGGRVTNLTGTATADELNATHVRALEAVTAGADDDPVLLGCL